MLVQPVQSPRTRCTSLWQMATAPIRTRTSPVFGGSRRHPRRPAASRPPSRPRPSWGSDFDKALKHGEGRLRQVSRPGAGGAGIVGKSKSDSDSDPEGSQPSRARQSGGVSAKRASRRAVRSAKRHSPWRTRSRIAWPVAGDRPKPTLDIVASTTLAGAASRSMIGRPSGVFSTTPAQLRMTRTCAARGRARRGACRGCGGAAWRAAAGAAARPRRRTTRAGRRHRRGCRAASGGRRGRCRRRRRAA